MILVRAAYTYHVRRLHQHDPRILDATVKRQGMRRGMHKCRFPTMNKVRTAAELRHRVVQLFWPSFRTDWLPRGSQQQRSESSWALKAQLRECGLPLPDRGAEMLSDALGTRWLHLSAAVPDSTYPCRSFEQSVAVVGSVYASCLTHAIDIYSASAHERPFKCLTDQNALNRE